MSFDFDLFVIGAGSGGVRAARFAAGFGARVAVAESRYLGGTCVNVGCVPKKLLVYGAHFSEDFEQARAYGWSAGEAQFDWATLIGNKNREIQRLNGIYRNLLVKQRGDLARRSRPSARCAQRRGGRPALQRQAFSSPPVAGRRCRTFPARNTRSPPTKRSSSSACRAACWWSAALHRRRVRLDLQQARRRDHLALPSRPVPARLRPQRPRASARRIGQEGPGPAVQQRHRPYRQAGRWQPGRDPQGRPGAGGGLRVLRHRATADAGRPGPGKHSCEADRQGASSRSTSTTRPASRRSSPSAT